MTIPLLVDSISTHHATACENFISEVYRTQPYADTLTEEQWRAIRKIIRDSVTMGALCEMNNPYPHPEQLNEIET